MAEIKPDLIPITNYLVWKNDTETNLMDKYLPKEFKNLIALHSAFSSTPLFGACFICLQNFLKLSIVFRIV
jgi:hypothetical protein